MPQIWPPYTPILSLPTTTPHITHMSRTMSRRLNIEYDLNIMILTLPHLLLRH